MLYLHLGPLIFTFLLFCYCPTFFTHSFMCTQIMRSEVGDRLEIYGTLWRFQNVPIKALGSIIWN